MRSKRVGILAAGATAVALLLSACSGGAGASTTGSGKPVSGGAFTIATNGQEPSCIAGPLDSSLNGALTARAVSDSVVFQNPDTGKIEPWLATSWKVSDDGLEYTFKLKHGVTFSDGSAWNAAAFKANLDWIVDPATKSPMAASYIQPYKSSEVVSDDTLKVTLSTPYSAFLRVLAQGFFGMISPKQIADDPSSVCTQPIGTGPFKVVKWTKGQQVSYTKNAAYNWGPPGSHAGPAYLDSYTIQFIADDVTRYNALTSGQVDAIDYVPAQDVATAKSNPDLGVQQLTVQGHPFTLWFNTSRAPFNDIKVRQALLYGVNRAQIVKNVMFGQYKVAQGYLSSSTTDFSPVDISYDPAKAKKLLDEAGWSQFDSDGYRVKDGKRLTATFPTTNAIAYRVQIAEQVQAAAKKLGIEIKITYPPAAQATELRRTGQYDLSNGIWGTNTPDVLWLLYNSHDVTTDKLIGLNASYLSDPKVDDLVQQARETTDASKQAQLYKEANQRLVELAPGIPFFSDQRIVAYDKTKVHDLKLDVSYPAVLPGDVWTEK